MYWFVPFLDNTSDSALFNALDSKIEQAIKDQTDLFLAKLDQVIAAINQVNRKGTWQI